MKTIGTLGLVSVLLMVAYNQVASAPPGAAQGPDRSVTLPVPIAIDGSGKLPPGFSEYVLLHETRYESIPVPAMAGMTTCPE